jgi:hypothetical protein
MTATVQAATLETDAPIRRDRDRCGRASRKAQRLRERCGLRALRAFLTGRICDACSRSQKLGIASKSRVFFTIAHSQFIAAGGRIYPIGQVEAMGNARKGNLVCKVTVGHMGT